MSPSISISYDVNQNTISAVVPESYAMADLYLALAEKIATIPTPTRFNVLIDVMRSQADRDFSEIKELIKQSKPLSARVIRVAVVVNRLLHFGMTNQAAFYAAMDGFVVRPFWTRSKAQAWLAQADQEDCEDDEAWPGQDNVSS